MPQNSIAAKSARTISFLTFFLIQFIFVLGCNSSKQPIDEAKWSEELESWRAGRMQQLIGDRGWATLTGLDWLKPGANPIGSSRGSQVQFESSSAPPSVGVINWDNDRIRFEASPGVEVYHNGEQITQIEMFGGESKDQVILSTGTVQFAILHRGDRYGVRTWDSQAPILKDLGEIPTYMSDPSWYVPATFYRYKPTKMIEIWNVLGMPELYESDGYLEFAYAGELFKLDVLATQADTSLYVIVGDLTNRDETYGGGRYLYVDRKDTASSMSKVWIDFNRVYNPPCAFTPYSTCALPPEQNKLPFPLTAGEKRYLR